MRYTLEQLEKRVPEILKKGLVNTPHEGYPILHSVAIELRDERDKTKHPRYMKLIKIILEHPICDVDVFDKHEKSLLMYMPGQDRPELLALLLQHDADPDLTDGFANMTALEWGIHYDPTSDAIPVLDIVTQRTRAMLKRSKELFESALDWEGDREKVEWINVLLDLKLVSYQKKFRSNLPVSADVPKGFWIRTVSDAERERDILNIRECWSDAQLSRLRHKEGSSNPYYTPYSPATFVRHSIPTRLFGGMEAGLMIRPSDDPIAYWYDGHYEELTREMSYQQGTRLSNGQLQGQYWELTATQIELHLARLYVEVVNRIKQQALEKPEEDEPERFDKHGVLLDRMLCDIQFSWNEGLLRYKRKSIFGICIDPNSKHSFIQGLHLAKTLKLRVPFYHYNSQLGTTTPVSIEGLAKKWKISCTNAKTDTKTVVFSNINQANSTFQFLNHHAGVKRVKSQY